MAKAVNVNNSVVKKDNEGMSMMQWIRSYENQIAKALPSVITPERFTRIAMTAVTQNPKLGECTPGSFIGSLLTAAQLGLEPNTPLGQAYLIPYKNKGIPECQFQVGYRGLIELAHRSGEIKDLSAHIVYENDDFEYELGLDPKLKHIPAKSDRGNIAWVYAVYHLTSGGFGFEVMSAEDVNNHKKQYSKSYADKCSPWNTSWEEMAKKTVIKKALKYAPMKTDFVRAVVSDEAKFDFKATDGENFDIIQGNIIDDVEVTIENTDSETGEIIDKE